MRYNDTFFIAKDGFKCIAASGTIFAVMLLIDADFLAFVTLVLFILTVWAYRNPERAFPYHQDNSIVSVCDGTVKKIETVEDENGNTTYNIVIANSFLDTSILRVPFTCKVHETSVVSGARLSTSSPLAERLNEKGLIVFGEGDKQLVVMHTLALASVGIKINLVANNSVQQGARYGLMIKGESMIVLPHESRVAVKVGDKVRAGETLIGFFS